MIQPNEFDFDTEKGNFHFDTQYAFDAGVGLSEQVVQYISDIKKEENWLLDFRLRLYPLSLKPLPTHWATKDLKNIDLMS